MSAKRRKERCWMKAVEKLQQDTKAVADLLREDLKPAYLPERSDPAAPRQGNPDPLA